MANPGSSAELESLDQQIAQARKSLASAGDFGTTKVPDWWSAQNAMTMCIVVLIFGAFLIVVAASLIRHGKSEESVLRILGTILVIVAALFLVVAGYDDKQMAPVMGFLGTIAGYLLGKEPSRGRRKRRTAQTSKPADD